MEGRRPGPGRSLGPGSPLGSQSRASANVAVWFLRGGGGRQVPQEAQWGPEQRYFLEKLVSMNTDYVNKVFTESVISLFSLSLAHNANWRCCYLPIITSFSFASLAGQRSSITLGIRISSGSLSWISSLKRNKTWGLTCEYAAPSEWNQTALCVPRTRRCGSRGTELWRCLYLSRFALSGSLWWKDHFGPLGWMNRGWLWREGFCLILKRSCHMPSSPDSTIWLD